MHAQAKIALALILIAGSASPVFADNYGQGRSRSPRVQAPASLSGSRMVEPKPGVWTSNYDCFTDDGYGRFRSCSAGGGN
jgi:hypothetical protein